MTIATVPKQLARYPGARRARLRLRRGRDPRRGPGLQAALVLAEARPAVQFLAALRYVCASGAAAHPGPRRLAVLVGWMCLSVAIYVYNGLTDVATDRPNGSSRPIASGRLAVRTAGRWCAGLVVLGLTTSLIGGYRVAALAAGFVALGWAYSSGPAWKNSRRGGAVVIGLGAALTYTAGMSVAPTGDVRDLVLLVLISGWVAVSSMSKDFSDVDGDVLSGRRSTPVLLGARRAARVLARDALVTSGAVAGAALALHSPRDVVPAAVLVLGSIALAVATLRFAARSERAQRRRPYRVFMSTQYAVNATLFIVFAG